MENKTINSFINRYQLSSVNMENKTINSFINRYQLSKTLRFKLKPVGETETNFIKKGLLEEDKQRAQDYIRIKHVIDDYHKAFVDKVLSDPKIVDANEYAELYYKSTKNDKEIKEMKDIEARLRKQISSALTKNPLFGKLFKKELFTDILPEFIKTYEDYEEKSRLLDSFNGFVTYFSGFFENRKNMYSDEEKSTAIAYRCINENLPKFLDNCKVFKTIKDKLPKEDLEELKSLANVIKSDLHELHHCASLDVIEIVRCYVHFCCQFFGGIFLDYQFLNDACITSVRHECQESLYVRSRHTIRRFNNSRFF